MVSNYLKLCSSLESNLWPHWSYAYLSFCVTWDCGWLWCNENCSTWFCIILKGAVNRELQLYGCSWYDVTPTRTPHPTLPASHVFWWMPNLVMPGVGLVQCLGILFCWNAPVSNGSSMPVPPPKESFHFSLLSWVIQAFEQAVVELLWICNGIHLGEYRGGAKGKLNLSLSEVRKWTEPEHSKEAPVWQYKWRKLV